MTSAGDAPALARRGWARPVVAVGSAAALTLLVAGCAATSPGPAARTDTPAASSPTPSAMDRQVRPVLTVETATARSCPSPATNAASTQESVVACSTDGTQRYRLGPAAVTGDQVRSVTATDNPAGGAVIEVSLDPAGTAALTAVTQDLAGRAAPQSQLAVYAHSQVLSAPTIMTPLTSGSIVVSGNFSLAEAQATVDGLTAG